MKLKIGDFFCLVGVLMLSADVSYAYLDPSSTTFLVQAVAGVVIALGAGVNIFLRKMKNKVNETLNIDENAKKEQEEDVVVFTQEEKKEEGK